MATDTLAQPACWVRGGRCGGTGYRYRVGFTEVIELVGKGIDAAGVAVIVIGVLVASVLAVHRSLGRKPGTYGRYRQQLGRSILLGLELLVAADIIRTVAVTPSLSSVLVLAVIVVIRTFLSFSLELEITGRWPWQKNAVASGDSSVARQLDDSDQGLPSS